MSWTQIVQSTYEANPTVYACVQYAIRTLAQAPIRVYDKDGKEIIGHWATKLLANPQPQITGFEFKETILQDMMIGGRYSALKLSNGLVVKGLQHLHPNELTPQDPTPEQQALGYTIGGYRAMDARGEAVIYKPEQVLYIKYKSPLSRTIGQSPLLAAFKSIDTDNEAESHVFTVLKNRGMNPDVVIETDLEISDEDRKVIKEAWKQNHGGDNAGGIEVLGGGGKIKTLGMTMQDLDLDAIRRTPAVAICICFGFPAEAIGIVPGLENSTYSNKEQAGVDAFLNGIVPLQVRIQEGLQLGLLNNSANEFVRFDNTRVPAYQYIMKTEKALSLSNAQAGFITIDEHRATLGLPPVDGGGGDCFLRGFALMTVPNGKIVEPPPPAPVPKVIDEVAPVKSDKGAGCSCANAPACKHHSPTRYKSFTVAQAQRIALNRLRLQARLAPAVKAEMVKEFEAQATSVFKAVKSSTKAATITPEQAVELNRQLSLLEGEWSTRTQMSAQVWQGYIVKTAADDVIAGVLSLSNTISTETAQRWIKQYTYKFAREISGASADAVRSVVQMAQEKAWTIPELRDELQKTFSTWTDARATMVAETETHRASNQGDILGYKENGILQKQWLATDGDACEFCMEMDGKVESIDAAFVPEGGSVTGKDGGIYTNSYEPVEAADLHPNCKCVIIPVIVEG